MSMVTNQKTTFDAIRPRKRFSQKTLLGGLVFITAAVLIASWAWIGINPFKLYEKRENAVAYLFGKRLTEDDKAAAMEQARRMQRVIMQEEAVNAIREEYQARGASIDHTRLYQLGEQRVEEQLAGMDKSVVDAMVHERYERILKDKKGGFFPPETHPNRLLVYSKGLVETLAIAIWGSLFAVLAAIPVSLFAANNTLEIIFQGQGPFSRYVRRVSQFTVRRFLDFCRGFNEFVMALIFVAIIGLGPFAGVMALAIHTFGILGKVFSEAIEAIEPGQVEAVLASGARPSQVVSFSVLPQVMPLIVSYSLLRFESNVRSATILGFVGAGGIGFLMFDKINGYQYREVATMMIMVIVSVSIIDYLCGKLRARFI